MSGEDNCWTKENPQTNKQFSFPHWHISEITLIMGQLSNFHLHDSFLGIPFRHKPGYHFHHREPATFRNSLVTENVLEQNDNKWFDSKGCEKRKVLYIIISIIYWEYLFRSICKSNSRKSPFLCLEVNVTKGNFQRIDSNLFKSFL